MANLCHTNGKSPYEAPAEGDQGQHTDRAYPYLREVNKEIGAYQGVIGWRRSRQRDRKCHVLQPIEQRRDKKREARVSVSLSYDSGQAFLIPHTAMIATTMPRQPMTARNHPSMRDTASLICIKYIPDQSICSGRQRSRFFLRRPSVRSGQWRSYQTIYIIRQKYYYCILLPKLLEFRRRDYSPLQLRIKLP